MLLLSLSASGIARAETSFVSIIIDDMGHSRERGERALRLPAPITFSMLPYAKHSAELARLAASAGREVMVHMPMANVSGEEMGPGGLTPELSHEDFLRLLDDAFDAVPGASGLNNHMGSLLTTKAQAMTWLMQEIKRRNLFFIDSRTTHETVASTVAEAHAVFSSSRDVFLDNSPEIDAMDAEFERLIQKARAEGTAIAIAHPRPATLDYLERKLPLLAAEGVQVVPASHTIALRRILARLQLASEAATD